MQKHCSRTISRIIVAVALVATGAVAAYAQPQVEIAVETGYTASEGIKASTSRIINGQIYNDLDITSGLLGTNTLGICGYQPATASSIVKNVALQAQSASR